MAKPIQQRRCKHVNAVWGGSGSIGLGVPSAVIACTTVYKTNKRKRESASPMINAALAEKWTTQDPTGFFISEKLDGMRCLWDGSFLWTRNGNRVYAPPSLVAALPSHVPLDGELFLGRGRFQECMSIVRRHVPDPAAWKSIMFMVFDAPRAKGTFSARIRVATDALKGCGWARVVTQVRCVRVASR